MDAMVLMRCQVKRCVAARNQGGHAVLGFPEQLFQPIAESLGLNHLTAFGGAELGEKAVHWGNQRAFVASDGTRARLQTAGKEIIQTRIAFQSAVLGLPEIHRVAPGEPADQRSRNPTPATTSQAIDQSTHHPLRQQPLDQHRKSIHEDADGSAA